MQKKTAAIGMVLILSAVWSLNADAAWVVQNKKKVTAWQGFHDSVGGAANNLAPWNWGGKSRKNKPSAVNAYR